MRWTGQRTPPPVGWRKKPDPEGLNTRALKHLIRRLAKMEKLMSQLDTDVAALTDAVTKLTAVAASAIDALGHIVDTSADEASVEAANAALAKLTTDLAAAIPAPPAPAPAPAPVEAPPADTPPADPAAPAA
jgi:peptidoglycan hydrolase CwlO-like protein